MRDSAIRGKKSDGNEFELNIDYWHSLKELLLQEQQLVEVDLDNLMYGSSLEIINLSKNQLSELDLLSLQFCRRLVSLDVSKNNLEKIDLNSLRSDHAGTHFLESIDLSNNVLTEIDLNHLVKCYNLKYLNLMKNKLVKIDLSPLRYCKKLEEILIDNNTTILWRSNVLYLDNFSKGLIKYSKKIKNAWREYQKEVEDFRKSEPLVEERLIRAMYLENIEKQRKFDWHKIYFQLRPVYYEIRKSYIYGCYRGTISIVFSLMESFLTKELPFEDIMEREIFLKKEDSTDEEKQEKPIVDPKKLNLSQLAKLAKGKGYISSSLYNRFYMYLPVRHNIVHYPESTSQLGFYRTSVRGTGTKSRGVGFESPNRIPILPLGLQEAAETGVILFLDLLSELKL